MFFYLVLIVVCVSLNIKILTVKRYMSSLRYLTNISSSTSSTWRECPWYLLQFYNSAGSYEIGDGPEYVMMNKSNQWVPFEYNTQQQPVEDTGTDGKYMFRYNGTASVLFKTRLKDDQTAIEFKLLLNSTVIHTYRTSLVHNGASVDVIMDHSFVVADGDILQIVAQAYANISSCTLQDTDDYGNPNTIIKFTFI